MIRVIASVRYRVGMARRRIADVRRQGRLPTLVKRTVKDVLTGHGGDVFRRLFQTRPHAAETYQRWVRKRTITPLRAARFTELGNALKLKPRFSVIMPTYNSPVPFLRKAIDSVVSQTYPHWELCLVDDGSSKTEHLEVLNEYARGDKRIKVRFLERNLGIAGASNEALKLATGDYISLLDHDDEIQPHTFFAFASAINQHPEADWLYSDEDKIDEQGRRFGPFFKPDWSPAYFTTCMYTCHLGVYRRSLVEQLGGFRSEFDEAQDYDLALRFASATKNIVHVPDVLYHWRILPQSTASGASAKPTAEIKARKAVQSFIDRGRYPGTVVPGPLPGMHRVRFDIVGQPLVSLAILSAGYRTKSRKRHASKSWYVLDFVRSIREKTTYPNIEIVVAVNDDFDPRLTEELKGLGVKFVHYHAERFNLSDKLNQAVEGTTGPYVVLLNDDMSVITGDWITEMLMWCQQDDVAGVGAKLFFPDGRLQHSGVLLLEQGPSHPYYLHDGGEIGQVANAIVPREFSAVTGACMMVRRRDYLAIGGFDPAFPVMYNDVDFCLRLTAHTKGRIVQTPYAQLYHYESVSRIADPPKELGHFNQKWNAIRGHDPFYNVHLSQMSNCFEISPDVQPLDDYSAIGEPPSARAS